MTQTKPRLTYFSGRGLGELPRLVLAEAGVDYEDVRVEDAGELKKTGKLPFGQLPILEIDGIVLPQSIAISRYVARKHNLYGANALEGAQIDAVVDGLGDIRAKWYGVRNAPEDKKAAEREKFENEVAPLWLGYLEKILASNNGGKGFFVGNNISLADIATYNVLFTFAGEFPSLLDKFPLLKSLKERVETRPRIAAWIAKRPVTAW